MREQQQKGRDKHMRSLTLGVRAVQRRKQSPVRGDKGRSSDKGQQHRPKKQWNRGMPGLRGREDWHTGKTGREDLKKDWGAGEGPTEQKTKGQDKV